MSVLIYPTVERQSSDLWKHSQGITGSRLFLFCVGDRKPATPSDAECERCAKECREMALGLVEPVYTRSDNEVRINFRLTERGEHALACINRGFVWNNDLGVADVEETRFFWRNTIGHLTIVKEGDYRSAILARLKEFHGGLLSHLVEDAVMAMMRGSVPEEWKTHDRYH